MRVGEQVADDAAVRDGQQGLVARCGRRFVEERQDTLVDHGVVLAVGRAKGMRLIRAVFDELRIIVACSAVELAENIRKKKVSSLEATENFFERIERLDPQLHSYLTLCQDQALADARAADEGLGAPLIVASRV